MGVMGRGRRDKRNGLTGMRDHLHMSTSAIALEQRFMFDAAGVATAVDAATHDPTVDTLFDTTDHSVDQALLAAAAQAVESSASDDSNAPQGEPPASQGVEIAFIDTGVANWEVLRDNLRPGIETVLIDSTRDGVEQMAAYLQGRTGVDAIHIISHGQEARLLFGTSSLEMDSMSQYADSLATIGSALSSDGDILLYGCDIGRDAAGSTFLDALGKATGADVAASVDDTGTARQEADWELEQVSGSIETDIAVTDHGIAAFDSRLAALAASDLVVIGYNADGSGGTGPTDTVLIVALANIPSGSVIFFTDYGWTGTGFTTGTENIVKVTLTQQISFGTVFRIGETTDLGTYGTVTGSFTAGWLSISGDQIGIYQTSDDTENGTKTFIYGFSMDKDTNDDGSGWSSSLTDTASNLSSQLYTGLTEVTSAGGTGSGFGLLAATAEIDNAVYNRTVTTGGKSAILAAIHNPANWTTSDTARQTFDTTPFGGGAPTVTLSVNNATVAEAAGTSTVTATLSAAAAEDTVVTLTASGTATGSGTDYTLSSTTITITTGQTTGTATVTAV
jgi:Domain of unknown function (DUF4347)